MLLTLSCPYCRSTAVEIERPIWDYQDDRSLPTADMELTRFPAHILLSHGLRFEVGW